MQTPSTAGATTASIVVHDLSDRRLDAIARTPFPVLILGERGTGKTRLAKHLHEVSGRGGAFIRESVAGIPHAFERALLGGHSRGSFTGAYSTEMGLVEAANNGTLFLDEIALASPQLQGVLLQLLDSGTIRRIGEVRDRPLSVRIIAATNADLARSVSLGQFRADLLDRFGFMSLLLPPLRTQPDRILPLATEFINDTARVLGLSSPPSLAAPTAEVLRCAHWGGNVRELEAACRFAVTISQGMTVQPYHLPANLAAASPSMRISNWGIEAAMEAAGGNTTAAARLLGISRRHLHRLRKAESKTG